MNLSTLVTAVWLILVGLSWLGWVAVSLEVLGFVALVAGVLIILEGLNVFNQRVGS